MSIKVHMKKRKLRNELEILKLIRIKILDLPADTVAQLIERRRDKPRGWVRILEIVRFMICSDAFILLCHECEALEGPISNRVCII